MSRSIVICANPFMSHFTPTLPLARRLRDMGNHVTYLGFADMEGAARREGFSYRAITSHENTELVSLQKRRANRRLSAVYHAIHKEVREHLDQCGADIVLIGISRFLLYLPPALLTNTGVVFYSLCAGEPAFNLRSPPVTSDYVLTGRAVDRVVCLVKWAGRFLRKGLHPRMISARLFEPWPTVSRLCREHGVGWKFGIDGFFPDFPVVVLGTGHLESGSPAGVDFAGLCIDFRDHADPRGCSQWDFPNKGGPLVYCCLGTMSRRYPNGRAFLAAVVELFRQNPQWNLVLSLGACGSAEEFGELTDNIHVADFVQQLAVLHQADLAVIHGGHGTVKECIHAKVPMLVFSCSYDQHGNAARVQRHGIGLKNPMLKRTAMQRVFGAGTRPVTPADIQPQIETLLSQGQYRKNITDLYERIARDNELERAAQAVLEQPAGRRGRE